MSVIFYSIINIQKIPDKTKKGPPDGSPLRVLLVTGYEMVRFACAGPNLSMLSHQVTTSWPFPVGFPVPWITGL